MESGKIRQEILLVTNTTFSKRQICAKNDSGNGPVLPHRKQLEEACWKGLLDQLLPEIMERPFSAKRFFLWHIRKDTSFIQMEVKEFSVKMEKQFSIDTGFFLLAVTYN